MPSGPTEEPFLMVARAKNEAGDLLCGLYY